MLTQYSTWSFFSIVSISFGGMLLLYWGMSRIWFQQKISRIARHHKASKQSELQVNNLLSPLTNMVVASDSDIQQRFHDAGIKNTLLAQWFMPLKYSALILGEMVIALVVQLIELDRMQWIAFAAIWAMVAITLPDIWLNARKTNRQRRISRSLPYLIDLMAICVQTGMTIEAALKYLAREISGFNPELGKLLDNTNQRARIVGMERALEELYQQVPSSEMRSFMLTLTQSMQHGSSIYTMLTTLSGDIREVQMLELEEQIGKLAAKMSIPLIVFILIPLVFVIAAPGVMRMMSHV